MKIKGKKEEEEEEEEGCVSGFLINPYFLFI